MQHRLTPSPTGTREPSASPHLHPVLLEAASSGKGAEAPAPHRLALRAAAEGPRPSAPDYRTTPEARGYGAG